MKPMQLNMAKMKKIAGDKKTSTFKHDDGHTMVILHAALPMSQRKMLEKMPLCEGGMAHYDAGGDIKPKDAVEDTVVRPDAGFGKVTLIEAEGGKVEKPAKKPIYIRPDKGFGKIIQYEAEGGELNSVQQAESDAKEIVRKRHDDAADKAYSEGDVDEALRQQHQSNAAIGAPYAKGGKTKMYADPTEPVAEDDSAPEVQAPPPVNPAVAQAAQNPMQGVETPQVPEGRNNLNPNGTLNPSAVAENTQLANQAQKDIDVAAGKAQANREAGYIQAVSQNQQDAQQKYNDIAGHVKDFDQFMAQNKIDPNHYVESMGTGKKVGTALSLFLGGLGTINGGTNPALDFLNRQIDRDIDAQKARSEQARTVYGAYKDLYGEGVAANNATKATMLDIYTHQANQVAAQLGTPMAAQKALQFGTAAAVEKSKLLQDAAVNLTNLPGTVPRGGQGQLQRPAQQPPGQPQAPGQAKPKANGASSDHILKPGANESFAAARYNPEYKSDLDEVKGQLEGASLADKAIDAINRHFPAMYANINSGRYEPKNDSITSGISSAIANTVNDIPGYIHKKGENLEGVPYIGPAISGAAKATTDTPANRSYDIDRDAMMAAVTAALVHSGMTPTDAHNAATGFMPIEGDTLSLARKKLKTAKEKIRTVTKHNALDRHHLTQDEPE
jgi:hypothetical protein